MKASAKMLLMVVMGAGLAGIGFAFGADKEKEGDEGASLSNAPQAVQDAIKKVVGDHKLGEIETETNDGKTTYEAEYKVGDADYAVTVSATGEILEHEVDVDLSAVPSVVTDAANKAHAGGTIKEASIVEANGQLFYEMDVKGGGDEKYEMRVKADGSVISDGVDKD